MIRTMDTYGPPTERERTILSVSQLNREARRLLESGLPMIWVEGEISNIARPSSGHWYFTLKDEQAQIRCAMFKNRNHYVKLSPRDGQAVVVRGRVSLYEARGDYQLIAENMQDAGEGILQKRFEALKKQLESEGLFDNSHKQSLPALPRRIGVITSPTGAVIRDILNVLKRRFPGIPVRIFPVAVQGEQAADQIVAALETAQNRGDCDVLILARGGGSLEDLWPFNEERVARAIYSARLPIVSAIGHETDVTIADFVADLRAPTPSAAAEMVAPDRSHWQSNFSSLSSRLARSLGVFFGDLKEQLHWMSGRHRQCRPDRQISQYLQRLDDLDQQLRVQMQLTLSQRHHLLLKAGNYLQSHSPQQRLLRNGNTISALRTRLSQSIAAIVAEKKRALGLAGNTLNAIGPQATLNRGYAIVTRGKELITQATQVAPPDELQVRLAEGRIDVTTNRVHKK